MNNTTFLMYIQLMTSVKIFNFYYCEVILGKIITTINNNF